MSRVAYARLIAVAGLSAAGVVSWQFADAATRDPLSPRLAEAAAGDTLSLGSHANLTMRFIQEDGPESGHVRVELTPETRPLTMFEARTVAQRAFLETLKERGLGDLTRITVVVRLMPRSHPDPLGAEQVVVYLHTGGNDWSVLPGE